MNGTSFTQLLLDYVERERRLGRLGDLDSRRAARPGEIATASGDRDL